MNDEKLCESAYLTATDPQRGPYLHGAAMVDRTSGTTHVYLVRGRCNDSVVTELHKQLVRAGRLPTIRRPRGTTLFSLVTLVSGFVVMGVVGLLLSGSATR